jgi:hypothetical protein
MQPPTLIADASQPQLSHPIRTIQKRIISKRHIATSRTPDIQVDKFIVQFLESRIVRHAAGTDDDMTIKPYKNCDSVSESARTWRYDNPKFPRLSFEREATRTAIVRVADLAQLADRRR